MDRVDDTEIEYDSQGIVSHRALRPLVGQTQDVVEEILPAICIKGAKEVGNCLSDLILNVCCIWPRSFILPVRLSQVCHQAVLNISKSLEVHHSGLGGTTDYLQRNMSHNFRVRWRLCEDWKADLPP